ncbi:MAG TPA: hypothetical protein VGO98_00600, partial [Candidatus Saccharimonadales bacterium]|nr:hypothetical protein [Candidatus Saccharimonadales bacterium]
KNVQSGTTTRATPVGSVTFTREGNSAVFKAPTSNIFYTVATGATSGGSRMCNLQLAITVNTTNVATGNLQFNDPGQTACPDSGIDATAAVTGTGPDPASFTAAGGGEENSEVSTCQIDGIGWILCPVMNFIGGITDQAYVAVQALLATQPLTFNTTANPIHDAWTIMRNFANIMFVVIFLLIIFSQLTSIGVSNYGIKKILPRLIIVAILVNLSYIVCALALDISNILGSSLKSLMDGITANYKLSLNNEQTAGVFNGDNMFTNVIGAVLAGGITLGITTMLGLSVLLPIAVTALAAIVTVVVVLTLRQALLITLIVISPLAFIAFLLPNTEDWFTKWRKLFTTLLLMYPIIALIFGVSAFTGAIIMNSASGNTKVLVQIMGAGVTIIPLFITPVIMKTAGTFLNRIGGNLNNPNKGPFDRMRKRAEGYHGYRQDINRGNRLSRGSDVLGKSGGPLGDKYSRRRRMAAAVTSFGATRKVNAEKQKGFAKAVADETAQEYFAKRALDQEGFAKKITGDKTEDNRKALGLQASSQTAVDKIDVESVKSREILLRAKFDPRDMQAEASKALEIAISDHDEVGARAAQNILLNSGAVGLENLSKVIQKTEANGTLGSEVSASLRKDINGAGLKSRDNSLATWSYTNNTLDNISTDKDTYAALSDKELIGQSTKNLQKAVAAGAISSSRAAALLSNDSLGPDFTEPKRAIIASAQTTPPSVNAPTQPAPSQVPPAAPAIPGTLNIPHTPPANANPGNSRTAPPPNINNFNGNNRSPGGVYIPNGAQIPPQQPPANPPQGPPNNTP